MPRPEAAVPTRFSVEVGEAQGFAYEPLPADALAQLAGWLRDRDVPGAKVIREGRLFRIDDLAVKFFGRRARRPLRDWLQVSPAVRFADLACKIEAIGTPRPVAALDRHEGGRRVRSLVCYHWIDGTTLEKLWGEDAGAVDAFPGFMVAMHRARVFHGDFHLHQALWDGTRWVLIDLDGLRHPLRNLQRRRLATEHWAHVLLGLEFGRRIRADAVRAMFGAYAEGGGILSDAAWSRVVARLDQLREVRGLQAPEDGD